MIAVVLYLTDQTTLRWISIYFWSVFYMRSIECCFQTKCAHLIGLPTCPFIRPSVRPTIWPSAVVGCMRLRALFRFNKFIFAVTSSYIFVKFALILVLVDFICYFFLLFNFSGRCTINGFVILHNFVVLGWLVVCCCCCGTSWSKKTSH